MLYHYTTLETYLKILEEVECIDGEYFLHLRATRVDKVNDPTEMIIRKNDLVEVVHSYEDLNNVETELRIAAKIEELSSHDFEEIQETEKKENPPYITCFSKKEDYLPMWSLYGDKHHGICLCFNDDISDIIRKYSPSKTIICGDVEYDDYFQSHAIKDSLDLYYNIIKNDDGKDIKEIISDLVIEFSPFIKNNDYSYENEYRICVHNYEHSIENSYTIYNKDEEYLYLSIPLKSVCKIIIGKKLPFNIITQLFDAYFKTLNCKIPITQSTNSYK